VVKIASKIDSKILQLCLRYGLAVALLYFLFASGKLEPDSILALIAGGLIPFSHLENSLNGVTYDKN